MTATAADRRNYRSTNTELPATYRRLVAEAVTYYKGALIADVGGAARKVTGTSGLKIVGWCEQESFLGSTTDPAYMDVEVHSGLIHLALDGSNTPTSADSGKILFAVDDQTVGNSSVGGTLSPVGRLVRIEAVDGTDMALVEVGMGGLDIYQSLLAAAGGYIPITLSSVREVSATGDVSNIAANGGVLASDTSPVYDAVATSNEHEILWATGNSDPIGFSVALPRDFDDTADATLDLEVSSGTTDAATIVCASAWSAGAAGTEVSDSTSDVATKSATPHRLSITIAASDIPAGARRATFRLTPPTHATDTISIHAIGLAYKRKLLT